MATTMSKTEIAKRIKDIETANRERVVGHDEGTHAMPTNYEIVERLDGSRFARRYAGAASYGTMTQDQAEAATHGRIRMSEDAISEMAAARRELAELRKAYRKAK